jgi:hypothetical protein
VGRAPRPSPVPLIDRSIRLSSLFAVAPAEPR